MTAPLSALGLRRRLGDREVVAGASLELAAAEFVALLGPSGSGKTTLLQLLGLLDRPDGGRLLLDGRDPWALSSAGRTRLRGSLLGFVFQQNNLLSHLSAVENVALPLWRLGAGRAAAFRAAEEWLLRLGLGDRRRARGGELSVGEAQRVAIARALAHRPRLVLADEPTGSLDSGAAALVLSALEEATAAGAALLLVTHDAEVARRAGRRLALRDGRLGDEVSPCP